MDTPLSTQTRIWTAARFLRETDASGLIEIAIVIPVLLLMLVGAVDFGRAYFVAMQVSSAAQAGAAYGQQSFTDTAGMVTAARLNAPNVPGLTVTASFGCECHDGTSSIASCSSQPVCAQNVLNYAEVSASAVYTPYLLFPGVPQTFTLQSRAHLRASQ